VDGELKEWHLTPRSMNKVQVIAGQLGPGTSFGKELFTIQCPVEIVHVVSGTLKARFATENVLLEAGDTLTFSGLEPHAWANPGDIDAHVIWVLVPAPWSRNNADIGE
jgi:uncharacterized cupin superfamily protein